jgi:hypothetical protein
MLAGMATENHFSRPDARGANAEDPRWVPTASHWIRFTGVLTGLVALVFIFHLPGFYVGDMSILIGAGWYSAPAAMIFSPVIALLAMTFLRRAMARECRKARPSGERFALVLMGTIFALLVAGVILVVAIVNTPSERWVP